MEDLGGHKDVLTANDVSRILRLSTWQIYEMWKRNQLPCFRIGRRVRMRKEWLVAWMEQQRDEAV